MRLRSECKYFSPHEYKVKGRWRPQCVPSVPTEADKRLGRSIAHRLDRVHSGFSTSHCDMNTSVFEVSPSFPVTSYFAD